MLDPMPKQDIKPTPTLSEARLLTRIEELEKRNASLEAKLAKAVEGLGKIAQAKVTADFDWTDEEINRERVNWYRRFQDIARTTLAEVTGGEDRQPTSATNIGK